MNEYKGVEMDLCGNSIRGKRRKEIMCRYLLLLGWVLSKTSEIVNYYSNGLFAEQVNSSLELLLTAQAVSSLRSVMQTCIIFAQYFILVC